jgi:hypothetical protein
LRSKWPAGPAAAGREEGAYLNRYVTDEQRSRRPIFIATLRAVASWLFFRVAHSSRINSDMLVASASAARTALKNSQLIRQLPDESHVIYGTGHKRASKRGIGWVGYSRFYFIFVLRFYLRDTAPYGSF